MPKQWRHFSVIALAILVAVFGVDNQTLSQNSTNPSDLSVATQLGTARAADVVDSLLPVVKTISLPPIPVKKLDVKEPIASAQSILLIDDQSKLPLFAKGAETRRSVASTTKIISALVVLENYPDLDKRIKVTQSASSQIGSVVGYRLNETVTIRQLLHGLLLESGNDSAKMLSELYNPIGGDLATQQFVQAMNSLASKLGMNNSQFADPAGLNDQGYSTATDMAKAMSALIKQPLLKEIINKANYDYSSPEGFVHQLKNSNRLVTEEMFYSGIIGGKTGFTPITPEGGAGHCLIAAAERNGHKLIVVVLGTHANAPQSSAEVARTFLEYGFNNFNWQTLRR